MEKRKTRSDKVFELKCKLCDYITTRTTNMKLYYLNNHANKKEIKNEFKYYCEACDFGNFSKGLFNPYSVRHILWFACLTLTSLPMAGIF